MPLAHGDHAQPVMVRAAAGPLATLELAFVHVAARIRHPAGPVHEAVYNVALVVRARGPLDRARRRLHAGTRRQPRRRRRSCRAWRRPVLRYRVIVWPPRPKVALFVRVRVRLRVGRLGPSKGGLQLALGLSEQSVGYYGRVGHWTEQRREAFPTHEVERRPPRRRDGATAEGPRGTHPPAPVLLSLYVFSRLFPFNCEGRRARVLVCARVSGSPRKVSFY